MPEAAPRTVNAEQFQASCRSDALQDDPLLEAARSLQTDAAVRVVTTPDSYEDDWDPWG